MQYPTLSLPHVTTTSVPLNHEMHTSGLRPRNPILSFDMPKNRASTYIDGIPGQNGSCYGD